MSDYKYQAVIKPFIADFITEDVKYQLLTIELMDDNTIAFDMHDTEKTSFTEEELKELRRPSSKSVR